MIYIWYKKKIQLKIVRYYGYYVKVIHRIVVEMRNLLQIDSNNSHYNTKNIFKNVFSYALKLYLKNINYESNYLVSFQMLFHVVLGIENIF